MCFLFSIRGNTSQEALIKVWKALTHMGCAENPYESIETMSQLSCCTWVVIHVEKRIF